MERSAVNSYTTAGATLGLLLGLYIAHTLIGLHDPGYLFSIAVLIATLPTFAAYWLTSRAFAQASSKGRLFMSISGWIVLAFSFVVLFIGMNSIFPKVDGG